MRRVELFELIRQDYDMGVPKREIARKHRVHRRTVRQAITSAIPPDRQEPRRESPSLTGEAKAFIDGILRSDQKAPRKQRHTARRIWQRVEEELHMTVGESTVRRYVCQRRRELGVGTQVFVSQSHPIGAQAEADFYEAEIDFPWGRQSAQIITLRSEFSAAAMHVAYPRQIQAALLEGLELGLIFHGGVFPVLRLDNLRLAVSKTLSGNRRKEQDRFIAFRSHYLFRSSFTSLGIQGAHEKGGVENEVGRFRRRWLTPVPQAESWEDLNAYLRRCCIADLQRRFPGRSMSVGEAMAMEQEFLKPLPQERFELAEISKPTVDSKARIRVKTNFYSVPASLAGRTVSVRVNPMSVEASCGSRVVAIHERLHTKNDERLLLDHYLEVLAEKPGAFPGSLALEQARQRGDFPASYDLWARLRARLGDKSGTKAMIDVLLLHRKYPKEAMRQAIARSLSLGVINTATIELLARQASAPEPRQLQLIDVSELDRYDRPPPELSAYDQLLCGCGKAS